MPFGVYPPIDVKATKHQPARICSICDSLEFQSDISKTEFWLCPRCSEFFRQYMRERMKEKESNSTHTMKYHD